MIAHNKPRSGETTVAQLGRALRQMEARAKLAGQSILAHADAESARIITPLLTLEERRKIAYAERLARNKEICAAYLAGESSPTIGKRYDLTACQVLHILDDAGIERRSGGWKSR